MIDTANQELLKAIRDLEIKQGDKTELKKVIAEAEKLKEADYEAKQFAEMKKVLKTAKEMLTNGDATQEMVDVSVKSLREAINKLVSVQNSNVENNNSQTKPQKGDKQNTPVKTGDQTVTTVSLLGLMFAAILIVMIKIRKKKNV